MRPAFALAVVKPKKLVIKSGVRSVQCTLGSLVLLFLVGCGDESSECDSRDTPHDTTKPPSDVLFGGTEDSYDDPTVCSNQAGIKACQVAEEPER